MSQHAIERLSPAERTSCQKNSPCCDPLPGRFTSPISCECASLREPSTTNIPVKKIRLIPKRKTRFLMFAGRVIESASLVSYSGYEKLYRLVITESL